MSRRDSSEAERGLRLSEGLGRNSQVPAPIILSGHQPTYLPGIIVFTKIALSSKFMFVGHCQCNPGSWHTRNYIRDKSRASGIGSLAVPVLNDFGQSINDTYFVDDRWKATHLKTIEQNYRKRPFFDLYFPKLKLLINEPWDRLGPMNMALIECICVWLRLDTEILDSRDIPLDYEDATGMLIDMCNQTGATAYLSSPGETYVNKSRFFDVGLEHHFLKFTHPVYDQGHRDFISNLSVIDLLFNLGPEAGNIVRRSGSIA